VKKITFTANNSKAARAEIEKAEGCPVGAIHLSWAERVATYEPTAPQPERKRKERKRKERKRK